jgi:hypothetical protein
VEELFSLSAKLNYFCIFGSFWYVFVIFPSAVFCTFGSGSKNESFLVWISLYRYWSLAIFLGGVHWWSATICWALLASASAFWSCSLFISYSLILHYSLILVSKLSRSQLSIWMLESCWIK